MVYRLDSSHCHSQECVRRVTELSKYSVLTTIFECSKSPAFKTFVLSKSGSWCLDVTAAFKGRDDADTERDRWKVAIFSSPAVSFITFWYQRFSFFEISAAFQLCDCWRRAILRAILARRHPGSEPCIRADECAFSTGVANLLHSLK
jgi:hypothetical protein